MDVFPAEYDLPIPPEPALQRHVGVVAPFDLALLPIGAYAPRWFMKSMHVNPEEAVRIHQDVSSRQSVAMHWGTFRLTEEPMDEPPKALAQALAAAHVAAEKFWVMQHGETRTLEALR